MCGGAKPNLPIWLNEALYAAPHGVLLIASCGWWSVLGFIGASLCKRTGHGSGMDLGHTVNDPTPHGYEKLEYPLLWLRPYLSPYWFDFTLMAWIGVCLAFTTGLLWALFINPFWGIVYILSGSLSAVAYAIGWKVYPKGKGNPCSQIGSATELGEYLTGCFDYFFLGVMFLASNQQLFYVKDTVGYVLFSP